MGTVKAEELGTAELHSATCVSSIPEAAHDKPRRDRKRTKTGCLTCRRRRIKCDEGKPICRNCQKSRRQCEGYYQRVVYRSADFQYLGHHGAATITFRSSTLPGEDMATFQVGQTSLGQPELRPRAIVPQGHALHPGPQQYQPYPPSRDHLNQSQMYLIPPAQPGHLPQMPEQPWQPQQWDLNAYMHAPAFMAMNVPYMQPPNIPTQPGMTHLQALPHQLVYPVSAYTNIGQLPVNTTQLEHPAEPKRALLGWPPGASSFHIQPPLSGLGGPQSQPDCGPVQPDSKQTGSTRVTISQTETTTTVQHEWPTSSYTSKPEHIRPEIHEEPKHAVGLGRQPPPFLAKQLYEHPEDPDPMPSLPVARTPSALREDLEVHQSASPARLLEDAAVELQDDNYYDVDQDDDMDLEVSAKILEQKSQGLLKKVVAISRLDMSALDVQGFDTFIYEGILDTYRPEQAANPLRNSATARVFAHFITATGPLLTIFVRQTRFPSNLHNDGPLPLNQQGLWTHIMPMAALHHQGLLQAILAISSLHIAKLQHVSETPSWKHYGYALKWIHRAVRNPRKRQSTAILAATLLLGYYEILAANHTNWNTHLAGAKQLVVETDFASATKEYRRMKAEKAARDRQNSYYADMPPLVNHSRPSDVLLDQLPDIDETVVGIFAGRSLNYDKHGQVFDRQSKGSSLQLDIVEYETLKDLFWWYCKQDVYQSIISGNALLMDFERWTDCPPRAPLNRPDAVYGSFDHLMIVLARIADFSVRDRERKLRVIQANGGTWRPVPGMQLGPPATQLRNEKEHSTTSGPSLGTGHVKTAPIQSVRQDSTSRPPPQMPFFGMAPSRRGRTEMPASYKPRWQDRGHAQGTSVPNASAPDNVSDVSADTERAVQDWNNIKAAMDFFASQLGPSFQPQDPECKGPSQSPFGPAIFYRSLDISCLWALYNMSLLILARAHPHMPPAAHVAAGVASHETRNIVMKIGRIAAGVTMPPLDQALDPDLAGAACDLSVPLFFAGIQYQSPDQRAWLMSRLFDVDRRAGWATAGIIAEGCQTAWVKAAEAGRGPPYDRVHRTNFADNRVSKYRSSFQNIYGVVKDVEEVDDNDRKFVHTKSSTRLHWGIGVIGSEDDFGPDSHVG